LAAAGGHAAEVQTVAQGGWSLADHVNSAQTMNAIELSKWNFVVLQEQSEIPSVPQSRTQSMYPAARILVARIREAGATPVFFLTWAHRDGWPENGMPNYDAMQAQLNNGYLGIAQELGAAVAPVGVAWSAAHRQDPQLALWQADGSHPTLTGTYLAGCVFYAVIFRQSPVGLSYTDGLPDDTARSLQNSAADTVLGDPAQWNLP
jgi:hypothetical protein